MTRCRGGWRTFISTSKRGDVLIWHANLLHGGSPVKNPRLSRKALVCHFFAKGCVCYHDLTATLTHTQLGVDLYKYKTRVTETPAAPCRQPTGLLGRVRAAYAAGGAPGVLKKAIDVLRRA